MPGDLEASLTTLNACISEIRSWMSANYLKLNDSKTEFFVAGSTHSLRLLPPLELTIGTSNIKPSDVIRNLGVSFNSTMSFSNHVNHLRQTINFQIRNLWRIRRFIDIDTSHHVARALITSRLDYCNALFTHLSSKDTTRLQRLQNSAARAVFAVGRKVEVAPLLNELHWLPISKRILFKVLLYVFKCLNNRAPSYLSDYFTKYAPARPLRSSMDSTRLTVPKVSNTVFAEKRFNIIAVKAWNGLPSTIRAAQSVDSFKKLLKSYLF